MAGPIRKTVLCFEFKIVQGEWSGFRRYSSVCSVTLRIPVGYLPLSLPDRYTIMVAFITHLLDNLMAAKKVNNLKPN